MDNQGTGHIKAGIRGVLGFAAGAFWALQAGSLANAQEKEASKAVTEVEAAEQEITLPQKLERYYSILQKRPTRGYMFDRFYNEWLLSFDVDQLQKHLENAYKKDKKPSSALLLAFFHDKQGHADKALEICMEALKDGKPSAKILFYKAELAASALKFKEAQKELLEALKASPSSKLEMDIRKLLGNTYARDNNFKEALKVWKELLDKNPDDADLAEDIIEMKISEGLFDEASADMKSLVEHTSKPYQKLKRKLGLGRIYQLAGKKEKALEVYREALQNAGAGSWIELEILSQIDRSYRLEADAAGLSEEFKKLVEKYPQRLNVLRQYSSLLSQDGKVKEAREILLKAISTSPDNLELRQEYIQALLADKEYDKAVEQFDALIKDNPQSAELCLMAASALNLAKKQDAIPSYIQKYLERSDNSETAYLSAARLYEKFTMAKQAGELYAEAMAKFKGGDIREAYAEFLNRSGKKKEALAEYRKLIDQSDTARKIVLVGRINRLGMREEAYGYIAKLAEEAGTDPAFLTLAFDLAIDSKKNEEALKYAMDYITQVRTTMEMNNALSRCNRALKAADKQDAFFEDLDKKAKDTTLTTAQAWLLVDFYERQGMLEQSDKVVDKLLAANPENLLAYELPVHMAVMRRDWPKAAQMLEKRLQKDTRNRATALSELVGYYVKASDYPNALRCVEDWKKAAPSSNRPWIEQAEIYSLQGDDSKGVKILRKAVAKNPDDKMLKQALVSTCSSSGRGKEALQLLQQMIEREEKITDKLDLSRTAVETAMINSLSSEYEKYLRGNMEEHKDSVFPVLALAELYRRSGDLDGRHQMLLKAQEMRKDDVEILHEIARVEQENGDSEAYIKTLRRIIKMEKDPDKIWSVRGKIADEFYLTGDYDKADRILEELCEQSEKPDNLIQLVSSLIISKRNEEALKITGLNEKLRQDNQKFAFLSAIANEENGNYEKAVDDFLRILFIAKDEPEKKAKKANAMMQRFALQRQNYMKYLPPVMRDFYSVSSSKYQAYQYRQIMQQRQNSRRYMNYYSSRYGNLSGIQFPKKADEFKNWALAHIFTCFPNLSQEKQDAILRKLEQAGVKNLTIKKKVLGSANHFNVQAITDEDIEKDYGKIGTTLDSSSIYIITKNNGQSMEMDVDKYLASLSVLLENNYQQLVANSLSAMLQNQKYLQFEEKEKELKAFMADLGKKLAKAEFDAMNPLQMQLLNPAHMQYVMQRVDRENEFVKAFMQMQQQLFDNLPKSLINKNPEVLLGKIVFLDPAKDSEAILKQLDKVEDALRKNPRSANNIFSRYYGYGYGGNQGYTLQQLLNFPGNHKALSQITRQIVMNNGSMQALFAVEQEKLFAQIEKLQVKPLKMTLYWKAGAMEKAAKIAQEILAEEKLDYETALSAASLLYSQQKNAEAAEGIKKLSRQALNQNERKTVEAVLAGLSLLVDSENKDKKALMEAGKKAALRLRLRRLSQQERMQLVSWLEEYGLTKEAEALDKKNNASLASGRSSAFRGGSMYMGGGSSISQQQLKNIKTLYNSGDDKKSKQAINMLVRSWAAQCTPVITMPDQLFNHSFYNLRNTFSNIARWGMADDFEKVLIENAKKDNYLETARCALYFMLSRKPKEAMEYLEKGTSLKKNERFCSTLYLYQLIAGDDFEKAKEQALEIAKNSRELPLLANLQTMLQQLRLYKTDSEAYEMENQIKANERMVELNSLLIKTYPEKLRRITNILNTVNNMLNGVCMHLGGRVGNNHYNYSVLMNPEEVLQNVAISKEEDRKKVLEYHKKAEDVFLKMVQSLINDVPDTQNDVRSIAYNYLYAYGKYRNNPKPLVEQISKQLADEKKDFISSANYTSSNGKYMIKPVSPFDYLVNVKLKKGDIEGAEKLAESYFAKKKFLPRKPWVKQRLSLFKCSAEDFPKTAKTYIAQNMGHNPTQGIQDILGVAKDRKLDVDIDSLLYDELQKFGMQHHLGMIFAYGQLSPSLDEYYEYLKATCTEEKAAERFSALVRKLARKDKIKFYSDDKMADAKGAKEGKKNTISRAINPNQSYHSTPEYGLLQTLSQIHSAPVLLLLEIAEDVKATVQQQQQMYQLIDRYVNKDLSSLEGLMKSPLVADFDGFRDFSCETNNRSAMFDIANRVNGSQGGISVDGEDDSKKATEAVKKKLKEKDTFGSRLLLAIADNNNKQDNLYKYILSQKEAIEKLPEAKQAHIKRTLSEMLGVFQRRYGSLNTNEGRKAKEQLAKYFENAAQDEDELALFLKNKSSNGSWYDTARTASSLLKKWSSDEDKLNKIVEHTLKRLQMQIRTQNYMRNGRYEKAEKAFIDHWNMNMDTASKPVLNIYTDLAVKSGDLSSIRRASDYMRRYMCKERHKILDEIIKENKLKKPTDEQIDDLAGKLADAVIAFKKDNNDFKFAVYGSEWQNLGRVDNKVREALVKKLYDNEDTEIAYYGFLFNNKKKKGDKALAAFVDSLNPDAKNNSDVFCKLEYLKENERYLEKEQAEKAYMDLWQKIPAEEFLQTMQNNYQLIDKFAGNVLSAEYEPYKESFDKYVKELDKFQRTVRSYNNSNYRTIDELLALKAYLGAGDTRKAVAMFSRKGGMQINDRAEAWLTLAALAPVETFWEIVNKNADEFSSGASDRHRNSMALAPSKEKMEQIVKAGEKEDPEKALFVKMLLQGWSVDPQRMRLKKESDQDKVVALYKDFIALPEKAEGENGKFRIVLVKALRASSKKPLDKAFSEKYLELTLGKIKPVYRDNSSESVVDFFNQVNDLIFLNRVDEIEKVMSDLKRFSSRLEEYQTSQVIRSFSNGIVVARKDGTFPEKEVLKKFSKELCDLYTSSLPRNDSYLVGNYVVDLLLLAFFADDLESFYPMYEKIKEQYEKSTTNNNNKIHISAHYFSQSFGFKNKKHRDFKGTEEQKVLLSKFAAMLRDEKVQKVLNIPTEKGEKQYKAQRNYLKRVINNVKYTDDGKFKIKDFTF